MIERKIMGCGKVALFGWMLVVLVLTGCGRGARKEVVKEDNDVVCIKRPDLRLVVAAIERDVPTMEAALQAGADVNTSVEGLGPPIVAAALTDNYKAIQLLLDKGANINARDSRGYTALINASLNNNRDTVQLLLSKGADVNAQSYLTIHGNKVHMTPLMIAKAKGYQDIVKLLMAAGAKE
jgi:ankyrin repeat protein